MNREIHKNKKYINALLYLYGFLLFYQLNIDAILPFKIQHVMMFFLSFNLVFCWGFIRKKIFKKSEITLVLMMIISSLYLFIRYYIAGNFNFKTNIFSVILIVNAIFLNYYLVENNNDKLYPIKMLLNLALFQALLSVIMLIFPSVKQVANYFYLYDKHSEIYTWVSWYRIYGLAGDFTAETPMMHGIIGGLTLYLGMTFDKKYYLYTPFIALVILLNGRWGLIVMLISFLFSIFPYLYKEKTVKPLVKFMLYSITFVILSIFILYFIAPRTYEWIKIGFIELFELFLRKNKVGNVDTMFNTMLYLPPFNKMLFGLGTTVYGSLGTALGYPSGSDIGFINDIFAGGVVYMIFHYYNIFSYILKNDDNGSGYRYISILLLIGFLLGNIKAQISQGGIFLSALIYIKLTFKNDSILESVNDN